MNALDKPRLALHAFMMLSWLKDSKIKAAAGILPMMARMHGVRRLSGLLCPDASAGLQRPGGETSRSSHSYVHTLHAVRPGCLPCKPKMPHEVIPSVIMHTNAYVAQCVTLTDMPTK